MFKKRNRKKVRIKKHLSIRKKLSGTPEKPRLCVYRALNNMFAQIIDDVNGKTLVSASTIDKEIKKTLKKTGNIDAAKVIGKTIAERANKYGIKKVVFDRSGYIYTGRVKALADAARESGLEF